MSCFWEYGVERLIKNVINVKNNFIDFCYGFFLKGMLYILEVGFYVNVRFRRRKNVIYIGIFYVYLYKLDVDGIFKMEIFGFEMFLD